MTSNLSTIASVIYRLTTGSLGGEFSGPVAKALAEHGWTPQSFEQALIERTSEKYAHSSGLTDFLHLVPAPPSGIAQPAKALPGVTQPASREWDGKEEGYGACGVWGCRDCW